MHGDSVPVLLFDKHLYACCHKLFNVKHATTRLDVHLLPSWSLQMSSDQS